MPQRHKGNKNYNIIPFNPQITQITQKATESEMRDDGVLLRYKRDKLDLLNYLIFSDVWQRENLSP